MANYLTTAIRTLNQEARRAGTLTRLAFVALVSNALTTVQAISFHFTKTSSPDEHYTVSSVRETHLYAALQKAVTEHRFELQPSDTGSTARALSILCPGPLHGPTLLTVFTGDYELATNDTALNDFMDYAKNICQTYTTIGETIMLYPIIFIGCALLLLQLKKTCSSRDEININRNSASTPVEHIQVDSNNLQERLITIDPDANSASQDLELTYTNRSLRS